MKHPELKFDENNKPIIKNDFEFYLGETVHDPYTFEPRKLILFAWSIKMQNDLEKLNPETFDKMYNIIGDMLKEGFIKLMKK